MSNANEAHGRQRRDENEKQKKAEVWHRGEVREKDCQAALERTDTHDWVQTKEANKRSPLSPCNQSRNRQGRAGFSFLSPGGVWGPMLVFQEALPNGSTHQSL